MAAKYEQIATLFDEHSKEVVKGREEWAGFLDTASRLYKYQFGGALRHRSLVPYVRIMSTH